ncbi:YbfB/YjiJ family MFS transporter [Fodinicurvata halophila]|uniref:YbfB/YjiJ family MFS transporter n=1 Tax=Fodinicurvata halophila TaxID=1419723 RepID=UPI0036337503
MTQGLPATWFGLALLSLGATLASWTWWPRDRVPDSGEKTKPASNRRSILRGDMLAIYASYGLIAIGLVPHMVFLADFIARGLDQGIFIAGIYWAIFGLGALMGPLVSGRLADLMGFGTSLRCLLLLNIATVGLLCINHTIPALALSSLLAGAAATGSVTLVLGQTRAHLSEPLLHGHAWSLATVTFALGQAASGYGFSWLFARSDGDFRLLFLIAAIALLLALAASRLSYHLHGKGEGSSA